MSEKRIPTYDLGAFKTTFCSPEKLFVTVTAMRTAAALGFGRSEIVAVIQTMENAHFQKSMTSHGDHRVWQDIYYVPFDEQLLLYVKFTADAITEFLLLSFKDADNG